MEPISSLHLLTEAVRNAGADIAPSYQEYIQLAFAIATDCGDNKEAVAAYLAGDTDTDKLGALVGQVGKLGVDGVPFFIIDRRLTIAGAQSSAVLGAAILQAISSAPR